MRWLLLPTAVLVGLALRPVLFRRKPIEPMPASNWRPVIVPDELEDAS